MAKRYDVRLTNSTFTNVEILYVIAALGLNSIVKTYHNYFPNNVTISNNILKVGTKYD